MLALKVDDTKSFMTKLLAGDTFDTFLFSEGSVTTFTTFSIDGTWHQDYFADEEQASNENSFTWKLIRPLIFNIVKGRHTPIHMRIVLKLAGYNVDSLLKSAGLPITREQVDGLFLNITYAKDEVSVTTGTSLKIFTLDKTLDHVWDDMVRKFLQTRGISAV